MKFDSSLRKHFFFSQASKKKISSQKGYNTIIKYDKLIPFLFFNSHGKKNDDVFQKKMFIKPSSFGSCSSIHNIYRSNEKTI